EPIRTLEYSSRFAQPLCQARHVLDPMLRHDDKAVHFGAIRLCSGTLAHTDWQACLPPLRRRVRRRSTSKGKKRRSVDLLPFHIARQFAGGCEAFFLRSAAV